MLSELRTLITHRRYIWNSALTSFRFRYGGTILGNFWHFAGPLALVGLLSIVFSNLMPVNARGLEPGRGFIVYLTAGIMLWLSFVDAISRTAGSLVDNSHYIRKLALPEIVFVSQAAISSALLGAVSVGITLLLAIFLGRSVTVAWISILPILFLLMFFAASLGLLLAPLSALVPDIGQALPIVFQVWFWLSPIVYVISAVPIQFHWIFNVNPFTTYVDAFRAPLLYDAWPTYDQWIAMVVIPAITSVLAFFVLDRLKAEVRDIL